VTLGVSLRAWVVPWAAVLLCAPGCGAAKVRAPAALPPAASAGAAPVDDPALATARELFPGVFGLPAGSRALKGGIGTALYQPITEYFPNVPPLECLNLLGQPALSGSFEGIAADPEMHPEGHHFTVITPFVFRDRRAGYILGIPSGVSGFAALVEPSADAAPDAEPVPPALDSNQGLFVDRLVLIEPDGQYSQGRTSIDFGEDGVVEVCPLDSKRRPAECKSDDSTEPAAADALPYRYDVTRCAPGCDNLCPSGITELLDCSKPPPPVCAGQDLRLFFAGSDIGERCQYETWTLHCAKSCSAGRCDAASPTLAFSVPVKDQGRMFLRTPEAPTVSSAQELLTFSKGGQELTRDKLEGTPERPLVPTPDGGAVFFGVAGHARKFGGAKPWQTPVPAKANVNAAFAVARGTVYAVLGSKLFLLDEASGQLRSTIDLPSDAKSAPVEGPNGSLFVSLGKELLVLAGTERPGVRVPVPAAIVSAPLVGTRGEVVVATDDGNLSVVNGTAVKTLAKVGQFIRPGLALTPDGALLTVTSEKAHQGKCTLHAVALDTGQERWHAPVDDDSEPPLVDTRGDIFVMSDAGLTALSSSGARRWSLDLMGEGDHSHAVLGPSGTLYFTSYGRMTALRAAAAAPPFEPAPP
jgi:outer membrane protein assembly factor BamB